MLEKLQQLEQNLRHLEKFRQEISLDEVTSDKRSEWALRYGFFETIQLIIDICCHIVTKYNLGIPKAYSECVEILYREKYLSDSVAAQTLGMVGLRNILVHEYAAVDLERLYKLLAQVEDIRAFAHTVKKFVE